MKRPLPTAVDVVVASVSQASIPGAEQACTSIAVLACAASLSSSTRPLPDDMEFWMWQAALLKRDMAFAKEVVNLLSPALPIACGNEVGGMGPEQLQNVLATVELPAVLTVGAVSVALLPIHSRQQQQQQQQQQLSDALRVVGLFDSHPQAAHDYKAVYWELESMQEVVAHFAMSPMTQFALCEVRSRPFRHVAGSVPASVANGGLIVFPDQEDAFRAADTLPPGFLYVFPRDRSASSGSKDYLVGGLEDFWQMYAKLPAEEQTYYDMARVGRPVTFFADLEYEREHGTNASLDPEQMVHDFVSCFLLDAQSQGCFLLGAQSRGPDQEQGQVLQMHKEGHDWLPQGQIHGQHQFHNLALLQEHAQFQDLAQIQDQAHLQEPQNSGQLQPQNSGQLQLQDYPGQLQDSDRFLLQDSGHLLIQDSGYFLHQDSGQVEDSGRLQLQDQEQQQRKREDFVIYSSCKDGKESFHVYNHKLWFSSPEELQAWIQARIGGLQQVYKCVWNAQLKTREVVLRPFPDMSVYSQNRCFRLCGSTKRGKNRPFVPLMPMSSDRDAFFGSLLAPPTLAMYRHLHEMQKKKKQHQAAVYNHEMQKKKQQQLVDKQTTVQEQDRFEDEKDGAMLDSGQHQQQQQQQLPFKMLSMSQCPPALVRLANVVALHFRPQRMRGFFMTELGIVTFSMVKHDCDICNDTHNNQVYVMADMKRRVFWQKCHADRSKAGPEVPFPNDLVLSLVGELPRKQSDDADENQMDDGGWNEEASCFVASSGAARLVLSFAQAVYASGRRSAPMIPPPGSVPVTFNQELRQYRVPIQGRCEIDGGHQFLEIGMHKMTIRCKGEQCVARGKRWERPSHSSLAAGTWDLSFLMPIPSSLAFVAPLDDVSFPAFALSPERFLAETNFFVCLGVVSSSVRVYEPRLQALREWCQRPSSQAQRQELANQVSAKVRVMSKVLLSESMEVCYRECLAVAPDFALPSGLLPNKKVVVLAVALFHHLAKRRGYKRVQDNYYVPKVDDQGRSYYVVIPLAGVMTSVCSFDKTPNLCASVFWSGRVSDDVIRMLSDENEFPSVPVSKRYLGFATHVYDLEENMALTWEEVRRSPNIMPFNFLDRPFPAELLEQTRNSLAENVIRVEDGQVVFPQAPNGLLLPPTPLFDKPLLDQRFSRDMIMWLYALMGRMFHNAGKSGDGDNWEVLCFLIGAPGTFKSSIIAVLMSFFQASQVGIIATRVEDRFPIASLVSKLIVVMTECGGCTLDRELLKQMASGDPISANTKHVSSVQVPNWVTPGMFAGNAMMNFKDPDGAVERRAGVFPFPRRIRPGEGIVDLVQRIITEESAALLIKINSVYLAMRRTIRQPIAPLLPPEVRLATHQAIIENDPLRSFIAQHCVTSGRNDHRIFWVDFVDAYQAWCKASGFAFRSASSGGGGGGGGGLNPYSQEMLTLFHRLNVRLSDNHNNDPLALIGMRPRVAGDPPYQSVFAVQPQDEEEDNSVDCCDNNNNNSSSSNEEDDEDDPDMDNFSMSD